MTNEKMDAIKAAALALGWTVADLGNGAIRIRHDDAATVYDVSGPDSVDENSIYANGLMLDVALLRAILPHLTWDTTE